MVNSREIEFGIKSGHVGITKPRRVIIGEWPVVASIFSKELCRQERDEVNLMVIAVTKTIK